MTELAQFSTQPIVITGVGLASPLGLSAGETWKNVLQNRCGIGPAPAMDGPLPLGKDAGQCPDLPADFAPHLSRAGRYLRFAIRQAMTDAGVLDALPCEPDRATVMLGTTLHGMRAGGRFLRNGDSRHLHRFLAGDVIAAAIDDLPLLGGRMTTCSACSSSLGSIALGITLLQSGAADLIIAGGYDPISEYAWAGFNSLRLVSDPPLRPFTRGRAGMKVSESYAIVVLERADDAERRGAASFAAIAGWGESADAHHLTQPHPTGDGALRAMRDAMSRANIVPRQLGLIAAHATGTPDNDAAENAAMQQLLASEESASALPPVVGFKSHLGHTLGGAGAAELILSGCALRDQLLPPTANIAPAEIEYANLPLATAAAPGKIDFTLNTSLGFGGANTSVVLSPTSAAAHSTSRQATPRKVVITGIGVLLPGIVGKEQLAAATRAASPVAAGGIDEAMYESLLTARRVRRLSPYVKMTLAAVALACRDAGLNDPSTYAAETAAILGTMHGSAGYCRQYYEQIVREGPTSANPLLFAEGVPNAAAAQLSLMLGLKQSCQTIIGTRTGGLDALRLASLRIAAGDWKRAIVSAGEEFDETINAAYAHCGLRGRDGQGFANAAGAIAMVLESEETAATRGATPIAIVAQSKSFSGSKGDIVDTIGRALAAFAGEKWVTAAPAATWLARAEDLAIRRCGATVLPGPIMPELFSAAPLASLAAVLAENPAAVEADAVVTLATDFSGLATAVRCEPVRAAIHHGAV